MKYFDHPAAIRARRSLALRLIRASEKLSELAVAVNDLATRIMPPPPPQAVELSKLDPFTAQMLALRLKARMEQARVNGALAYHVALMNKHGRVIH